MHHIGSSYQIIKSLGRSEHNNRNKNFLFLSNIFPIKSSGRKQIQKTLECNESSEFEIRKSKRK